MIGMDFNFRSLRKIFQTKAAFKEIAIKHLSLLVLSCFIAGCSGNGLVKDLYSKGVKPSSTSRIVFIGSEADYGSNIQVTITDRHVIDAVWDSILNSKNYGKYSACGYRTVEFYCPDDSVNQKAVLKVMCGGMDSYGSPACLVGKEPSSFDRSKGGRDGLYQCKGLDELILKYLKAEYEMQNKI